MQNLKILNSKEVKRIMAELNECYGTDAKLDFAFFENAKGKIYILSKKFGELDDSRMRINNLGMYFGKREKDGIRLSIEGAQMVNPKDKVVSISDDEVDKWMAKEDLETDADFKGYVVVKNKGDVYGVAKCKGGKLMNMIPKDRIVRPSTS